MDNIKIDSKEKLVVLRDALNERYSAQRIIRERVQNTAIWILGVLLAASGWLISSETSFDLTQKILFTTIIVAAYAVIRFIYFADLESGFKNQQKVAARIEKLLGFFEPNFYDAADNSPLYPEEWKNAGGEKGSGKFFNSNDFLIFSAVLILIVVIWIN